VKVTVVADEAPGAATLVLSGELDLATAVGFEARTDELLSAGRDRLVVDLSGLTFCDSVGLNALVRARNRCHQRGGWLRVSGTRGQVAHVIRITGLLAALAADE
jgi:anti-sigma B factor antagonist